MGAEPLMMWGLHTGYRGSYEGRGSAPEVVAILVPFMPPAGRLWGCFDAQKAAVHGELLQRSTGPS